LLKTKLKKIPLIANCNSFTKAYYQEYKAKRTLKNYHKNAKKKGFTTLKGQELEHSLRKRLKKQSIKRWPKKKGDLHIFLYYYVSNWESILPTALKPFGKVTSFEWRSKGFIGTSSEYWKINRAAMNSTMLEAFKKANRKEQIDVVIGYMSGQNTMRETLTEMSNSGAAIFNFCWDDKLNFPGKLTNGCYPTTAEIADKIDLNLTNSPESIIKYASHGGLAIFWPEAAHPEVHKPYDLKFAYDVSFVGACYGWRPKFIKKLQQSGINVECFGPGWPNGKLSETDMIKLYSSSRINLGFSGIGYSKKLMCLKGRDFEVPMCGGLYLTQDNPELSLVFNIGHEIVTYKDETDCVRKINMLLYNPEKASKIRTAGMKRCLAEHTYEKRWTKVFSLAGIIDSDQQ